MFQSISILKWRSTIHLLHIHRMKVKFQRNVLSFKIILKTTRFHRLNRHCYMSFWCLKCVMLPCFCCLCFYIFCISFWMFVFNFLPKIMFYMHFLQAPQEIVSLFSGSRQVVYGLVDNCTQVGHVLQLSNVLGCGGRGHSYQPHSLLKISIGQGLLVNRTHLSVYGTSVMLW